MGKIQTRKALETALQICFIKLPPPMSASGTNQGAIDNRIEQAMDLVKSHLMNAVRSEVEELKDKIKIMEATICNLQAENDVLKRNVPGEVLLQLQTTSLPALAGPEGSATSSVTLPSMSASAGGSAAPSNFTESGNTSGCSSVPVNPPPITANAAPAAPGMAAPTPQMPAAAAAAAQQAAPPPPPAAAAAAPTPPPSDSSAASSHNIQQQ